MAESRRIKVGLLGLDTSHAVAFTRLLNDPAHEHHIPGATVAAAWPGGTPGWPVSIDRVPGFRKELEETHGIPILDSPEAVAEAVDLVLITAVDGRVHRELVERVLPAGKPLFVDKPFALTSEDAVAMIDAAQRAGVPLMSSSSLRFADGFTAAVQAVGGREQVTGIDVFGPLRFESAAPGIFWYGCHAVEMLIAALGPDCDHVRVCIEPEAEVYVATWADGRCGTYRGNLRHHTRFGGVVHGASGCATFDVSLDKRPFYASLVEAIVGSLPDGRSAVPADEMAAVVRFMEAANVARESGQSESLVTAPPVRG